MTETPRTPDAYVLDALANDVEDLESILRMLNSDTVLGWHREWGRKFERSDLVEALSRMIREDWVRVLAVGADGMPLEDLPPRTLPPGDYSDFYFGLTSRGRLVHRNWQPELH